MGRHLDTRGDSERRAVVLAPYENPPAGTNPISDSSRMVGFSASKPDPEPVRDAISQSVTASF
jgi:hypothetical protein